MARGFVAAGLVVLGNVYDQLSRTRPGTVRRLAGGRQAEQARAETEQRLRNIVLAYEAATTSLTLRLLSVEDVCSGGGGWTFTAEGAYKVSCTLYVTAYYSVRGDMGAALSEILAAGDRPGSPMPFGGTALPPDPRETGQLLAAGQSLAWDTPRRAVEELRPCLRRRNEPPVYRCLREPAELTVSAVRQTYGTVLQLGLNPVVYFRVGR